MAVKQDRMSVEDLDREPVCAGCEHPPDEDEELYPVVLNPQLESDDTPDLAVDRTQETIEFDPDDLQSFLDQYTDREVEVVADHIFWMHEGCIESLFDVDVEAVEDGVSVSERGVSSEEPSEDDSQESVGMSKPAVVISWFGVALVVLGGLPFVGGTIGPIPQDLGLILLLWGWVLLVWLWPDSSSRGRL